MNDMEEKIGSILNNPQMMQQIMSMAQSLNLGASVQEQQTAQESVAPGLDPKLLQSIAGIAQQGRMDSNQQTLLSALCPYLSDNRIHKLEKAMRAAKMAGFASSFLNSGGLQLLTGR